MSKYALFIRKGKIELSVSTEDKELITSEMEKWVEKASAYLKKIKSQEGRERAASQIDSELKASEQKIDEQLKRFNKQDYYIENDESAQDSIKQSIDTLYSQKNNEPNVEEKKEEETKIESAADFDSILDKSMNTPQEELSFKPTPSIKKDNAFLSYIGGRKNAKKIDYLLLTAYYFTQYEQKPRFTIKQLNAKLMQNLAVIIDHAVLQEAIDRGYIECLPDLTGIVGSSEYRLTSYGEKFILES